MNTSFQFFLPVNLIFGPGKVETLGEETAKYGKRAMIVTGRHSTKKSGLLDRAEALLKKSGVEVTVFDEAEPNPTASCVMRGASIAKENGCDVIVGLGGGSIMDCSKAIAFSVCNEGDVFDYIYGIKTGEHSLPLVVVPTTCGTGSEGNRYAVLTEESSQNKQSLKSNSVIPKVSIVDPELMMTMPKKVLSSVGFDALSHCMEAYIGRMASPITDIIALEGIRLLAKNLVSVYENPDDIDGWCGISLASTLGGMAIGQAGCAAAHGMEHPASGLRNITHGRGLAALTPVIYSHSIDAAREKFAQISRLLGGKGENDCIKQIVSLLDRLDLNTSLSAEGILHEDLTWLTENVFKVSTANMNNHPKAFNKEEIYRMYEEAF